MDRPVIIETPLSVRTSVEKLVVRPWSRDILTPAFLRQWKDLARRSVTPNPFLEPEFVLAALDHLQDLADPVFLTIDDPQGRLLGLGVFEEVAGSRRLPIPHLRSWQTPHTYLDSLLLDRRVADEASAAFWHYLAEGHHSWHGVEFPQFRLGDTFDSIFNGAAGAAGVELSDNKSWSRATLRTDQSPEQMARGISSKRAKSLRRGWHELERRGPTTFHLDRCDDSTVAGPVSEFLRLEALGWKAEQGTALDCCEEQRGFFRAMMSAFAASGRTLFSRIEVGGETVATVAHILSGEGAFAFKLGWDPSLERGCPGFQLKSQLVEHAEQLLPETRWVDSCSTEGSFIEHVWADRSEFRHRLYLTSRVASVAASVVGKVRVLRDVLLGRTPATTERK